ncbi:putative hydroxymethylpyrimidine transporter CytX [Clostridium sediminicola]|uniref:putative hydroxymethylpyrimidine transporter CytX n=1 Tax=Clostridium sediminicola TaxID=3114879 RepID=UPI0031F1D67E
MANNENKLSFWSLAFLWCGASISIAEILTGGFIAPLGFKIGLVTIIIGHLIGTVILALGGIIGTRERIPAITSTRISFGLYGTYLFSILNVLQLLGWTAIMIKSAALSLNVISDTLWNINNISLWIILIGLCICFWIFLGIKSFKKLNVIAVVLLFGLTLVLASVIFSNQSLFSSIGDNSISFGGALELSVVMPLSWLPLIADYTRFAKSEKAGTYGSFIGYFLGSSWMYVIGLGAAIVTQNPDPSAIMLAANLGITAFGIVFLSTITTTFMDAYSAGVTFLNLMPKLNEKKVSIFMTVIGTLISLVFAIENYDFFLYAIGSVFAPLFSILLTDYFIIKVRTKVDEKLLLNIGAVVVWIIGVSLYYVFIRYDFILGATLPTMIVTGLLYFVSWSFMKSWKLNEK